MAILSRIGREKDPCRIVEHCGEQSDDPPPMRYHIPANAYLCLKGGKRNRMKIFRGRCGDGYWKKYVVW